MQVKTPVHKCYIQDVNVAVLLGRRSHCACPSRYSDKLGFRERSETADIAIELSLQPWRAFQPDGVIMFSDILTPLPAMGIEFDVVKGKGPIIEIPIRR